MSTMLDAARAAAVDLAMILVNDDRLHDDERGTLIDYLTGDGERPPKSCLWWEVQEAMVLEACRNLFRATRVVSRP